MFFIFDNKNPKILLIFVVVIILGVLLEYLNFFSTEKTVGIAVLIYLAFYTYKNFK